MKVGPPRVLVSSRPQCLRLELACRSRNAALTPSCTCAQVSLGAMPMYAMLPTLTEYCVEQGWTLAYARWVAEAALLPMPGQPP
jgi:hypothetical protein